MGDSSSTLPAPRGPLEPPPPWVTAEVSHPPPPQRTRIVTFVVLLLLTFASTSLRGGLHYSLSLLAILGAHEFGHYFACRYYGVNASLPYFLPMPLMLFGTLGAFIRIRQPIARKRELFDIGIAGPIAGFVVAVPLLFVGVYLSNVLPRAEVMLPGALEFGEPILVQIAAWLTFGPIADDHILVVHPIAFAALFGLIVTSLNLFPFGQLDGGHISYAVFGARSTIVTKVTAGIMVLLAAFVSLSWIAWAAIMVIMLVVLGPTHPRVMDEDVPLDSTRLWLAVFAAVMFVLCFTPTPIEINVTGR
jgi:membrane-associated protease RseP (regulator of RpoE activity)